MTYPNNPLCFECEIEQWPETMSVIHPDCCVWCAKKRIEKENAERDARRAKDFQDLSRERFLPGDADALIFAAEAAKSLLGPRYHAESLLDGTEPTFSAERDSRHLGAR